VIEVRVFPEGGEEVSEITKGRGVVCVQTGCTEGSEDDANPSRRKKKGVQHE
jgi:hypothetical protein